jgi:hypothetical protein
MNVCYGLMLRIERIRKGFEYHYNQYSRIKKEDIDVIDYDISQD